VYNDRSGEGWGISALGLLYYIVGWIIGGLIAGPIGTIIGTILSLFIFGGLLFLWTIIHDI